MSAGDLARQGVILTSLERVADDVGDITRPLIDRFYAVYPDARAAFSAPGLGSREKLEAEMVGNFLYFVMTWFERPGEIRHLLYTSIPHHAAALGVSADWYRGFIDCGIDLIIDALGDGVTAGTDRAAWEDMRAGIADAIKAAEA
jgi:hypothetical protein